MTFQNVPNVQLPLYHLYSSLRVRSSRLKPNVLMSFAVSAENFHAEKFPLILLRSVPLHIAAELLIRCDKSNIRVMWAIVLCDITSSSSQTLAAHDFVIR